MTIEDLFSAPLTPLSETDCARLLGSVISALLIQADIATVQSAVRFWASEGSAGAWAGFNDVKQQVKQMRAAAQKSRLTN